MIVSSQLFESYSKCPTKCWLYSHAEPITGNHYAEWARVQNETYCREGIKCLHETFPESDCVTAPPIPKDPKNVTWRLAIDVCWKTRELESCVQAIERTLAESRDGTSAQFIPYRFEFLNKVTEQHKLLLTFDALLLSEAVGRDVTLGKIVHGDNHTTLKVKTLTLASEVRKRIRGITALLASDSPPDLVLNGHCGQCEFQTRCRTQAAGTHELSLLAGISQKERKKLHGQGIFTVTQLSYTFRPRRRRRESRGKQEKHHHSLRALAIRENRIHAVSIPDPKLEGTRVFLDVEGLPDRDFYYLIGVRVQVLDGCVQHSFWAADATEENLIWNSLLGVLSQITNPCIIHYGSYETIFLKRMCERYGCAPKGSQVANAVDHPINLLSLVYAQIYFPTYSNGLKEIAGYLGFRWSGPLTSGLETIVWRHRWEAFRDPSVKQALFDYNRQDCEALEILANRVADLNAAVPRTGKPLKGDLVLTSDIKRGGLDSFKRNNFIFPEMEVINKAAYWDYQRERVYVKSLDKLKPRHRGGSAHRNTMTPNTTIECSRPSSCPTCGSKIVYKHGKRTRIIIDLRFIRHGIKRWITRHLVWRYRCPSCGSIIHPHDRQKFSSRYGPISLRIRSTKIFSCGFPRTALLLA